ncbi:hypothetical protein [Streptomyces sp. NPDC093984]|uniref:hypothetical protein n=1 Tax=Streptomyces sp. NPDC093984 TaxID=3366052 RepID=UPI00382E27F9
MTEMTEEGLSVARHIFNWMQVQYGWASFELLREGSPPYRATVSDSTDVFRVLLEGARLVLDTGARQEFSFDNEPGEIRWTLEPHGDSLNLRVAMHSEWGRGLGEERWAAEEIDPRVFASDVLSSTVELISGLGVEGFRRSWPSYPYPVAEVEALKEILGTS